MSFVDALPPSATAKAVEDSTVFGISKAALSARLQADILRGALSSSDNTDSVFPGIACPFRRSCVRCTEQHGHVV
jgi:hypothetical protein